MEVNFRRPENIVRYSKDSIYSNLTKEFDYDMVDYVKCHAVSAFMSARDYFGEVWWNDQLGYWCIEIWQYKKYNATYIAETLEDLIIEVHQIYGDR